MEKSNNNTDTKITTLIFDVDDTLYDVGTGFTAHRNTYGAQSFMLKYLNFPDMESAKIIRDEYFTKYHSTAKALQVAEQEGKLPSGAPKFDPQDLAEHWASSLNFALLGAKDEALIQMLKECPLKLVAFSNGPRKYVKRVLMEMGLAEIFPDDMLFAVDDVLPYCKPEKEAFDLIFERIQSKPNECIMVEDSMKNIRMAKSLGMKTILVAGKGRYSNSTNNATMNGGMKAAEATKTGDAPEKDDPAVNVCVEVCSQIRDAIPELWQ